MYQQQSDDRSGRNREKKIYNVKPKDLIRLKLDNQSDVEQKQLSLSSRMLGKEDSNNNEMSLRRSQYGDFKSEVVPVATLEYGCLEQSAAVLNGVVKVDRQNSYRVSVNQERQNSLSIQNEYQKGNDLSSRPKAAGHNKLQSLYSISDLDKKTHHNRTYTDRLQPWSTNIIGPKSRQPSTLNIEIYIDKQRYKKPVNPSKSSYQTPNIGLVAQDQDYNDYYESIKDGRKKQLYWNIQPIEPQLEEKFVADNKDRNLFLTQCLKALAV